jgi:pectate lyase
MDGNFDIKNMSDFISITWCKFSYEKNPHSDGSGGADDHRFSNLIGSSDDATDDDGKLNITFDYCWWAQGCVERMPRMRFGKLHMANNLFTSTVSNTCIRAGYKADILAQGNYFDKQKLPIDEFDKNYTAIKAVNNYGQADMTKNTAFTPPYTLTIANAADIVDPIKNCAGATMSSPTGCSTCGNAEYERVITDILLTCALIPPVDPADTPRAGLACAKCST